MLGARVQRSPILDLQQPPSPSTGEVWPGHQGELPGLWGRVHQDNCTEWSPLAPKVQAEETAFDELVMRKTLKGEAKTKKKKGTKDREKKYTPTTKAEMWACMIPGTLSQSFCAYFEGPIALLHYERYNSSGWHSRIWADLGVTLPGRHGSTMRE